LIEKYNSLNEEHRAMSEERGAMSPVDVHGVVRGAGSPVDVHGTVRAAYEAPGTPNEVPSGDPIPTVESSWTPDDGRGFMGEERRFADVDFEGDERRTRPEVKVAALEARIQALEVQMESVGNALGTILEKVMKLEARFPDGEKNRSAPLERSMTEGDAEFALLDPRRHEEVARHLGLVYGQVYSARMEYTFKRVRRRLEKAGRGAEILWHAPGSTVHRISETAEQRAQRLERVRKD
jgi:hypothetical protein